MNITHLSFTFQGQYYRKHINVRMVVWVLESLRPALTVTLNNSMWAHINKVRIPTAAASWTMPCSIKKTRKR